MALRRTKKVILAEKLAADIRSGLFAADQGFPTTAELVRHYRISAGTAGKVLHDLERAGLIDVTRGRRSKVLADPGNDDGSVRLDKPVGVVGEMGGFFRVDRWRELVLHNLQQRLLSHGNQPVWLPADFELNAVEKRFSGIVFAGGYAAEPYWRDLLDKRIPCVQISFLRPLFNTVYNDYRPAMDQVALHLIRQGCRRVFYLVASEAEAESVRWWFRHIAFPDMLQAYGIPPEFCGEMIVAPTTGDGIAELSAAIRNTREKVAFMASSTAYNQFLIRFLPGFGLTMGKHYELYSLSFVTNEVLIGHNIDIRHEVMVDKMLALFYRQIRTGKPQIGEVMFPQFIPG